MIFLMIKTKKIEENKKICNLFFCDFIMVFTAILEKKSSKQKTSLNAKKNFGTNIEHNNKCNPTTQVLTVKSNDSKK
jgi:hypothetical protein